LFVETCICRGLLHRGGTNEEKHVNDLGPETEWHTTTRIIIAIYLTSRTLQPKS